MKIEDLNPKEAAECENCGEALIGLNKDFIEIAENLSKEELEDYCILCLDCETEIQETKGLCQ